MVPSAEDPAEDEAGPTMRHSRQCGTDCTSHFWIVVTFSHHDEIHDRSILKRDLLWLVVSEGSNYSGREEMAYRSLFITAGPE